MSDFDDWACRIPSCLETHEVSSTGDLITPQCCQQQPTSNRFNRGPSMSPLTIMHS